VTLIFVQNFIKLSAAVHVLSVIVLASVTEMWLGSEYNTHSQAELTVDHSLEISRPTFRHGRTDRRTDDKLCHERKRYCLQRQKRQESRGR